MKHTLKISVSKNAQGDGIVSCRHITFRDKLFNRLFGNKRRLTVIFPGDSVESLSIHEIDEEGGHGHE